MNRATDIHPPRPPWWLAPLWVAFMLGGATLMCGVAATLLWAVDASL